MTVRADSTEALARWPSRGNRRRLEKQWHQAIERRGLRAFLPEAPPDIPAEIRKATDQFNAGEFWDCHETLEAVWLRTPYPLRLFYHAIIKAAVGFHHATRHNRHGAHVKLSDSARTLALFPPQYMGLRAGLLRTDISRWLAKLDVDERIDWTELDALSKPTIRTSGPGAKPRSGDP